MAKSKHTTTSAEQKTTAQDHVLVTQNVAAMMDANLAAASNAFQQKSEVKNERELSDLEVTISKYVAGIDHLNNLPVEFLRLADESALWEEHVARHSRKLIKWKARAESAKAALAALRVVRSDMENFRGNPLSTAMFDAAFGYYMREDADDVSDATKDDQAELTALIDAHRNAYSAFIEACDAEEGASVARTASFKDQLHRGPFASSYEMGRGEDWVKEQVSTEIAWYREKMKIFKNVDPTLHEQLVASLNQCENDHLSAIELRYADTNATYSVVRTRYDELNQVEFDALLAVCAFVCSSPAELRIKGDYLAALHNRGGMIDEHYEALIESMKTAA